MSSNGIFSENVSKIDSLESMVTVPRCKGKLINNTTLELIEEAMPILERGSVNECQRELFCSEISIVRLPSSQGALIQHVKWYHSWPGSLDKLMLLLPFPNVTGGVIRVPN